MSTDPPHLFDEVYQALDDPMDRALATCLREIESDVHRHGWDQPPRLLVSYRALDVPLLLPAQSTAFVFKQLGPNLHGDGGMIANALNNLAHELSAARDVVQAPDTVFAWALLNEAWMASARSDEDSEQLRRDAYAHVIDTRPDRQEVRLILAVDRLGTVMQLMHLRASNELWLYTTRDTALNLNGDLPDALRTLMRATLGEQLAEPPRSRR